MKLFNGHARIHGLWTQVWSSVQHLSPESMNSGISRCLTLDAGLWTLNAKTLKTVQGFGSKGDINILLLNFSLIKVINAGFFKKISEQLLFRIWTCLFPSHLVFWCFQGGSIGSIRKEKVNTFFYFYNFF